MKDPVSIRYYPAYGRDGVRTPMQWTGAARRRVHRCRRRRRGCPFGDLTMQRRGPARRPGLVPLADPRPHRPTATRSRTCSGGCVRVARRARGRARLPARRRTPWSRSISATNRRRSTASRARSAIGTRRATRRARRSPARSPSPRPRASSSSSTPSPANPAFSARSGTLWCAPGCREGALSQTVAVSWAAVQARRSSTRPGVHDAVGPDAGLGHPGAAVGLPGELARSVGVGVDRDLARPSRRPSRAVVAAGRAARGGS